ncbi:MAG: Gfo/Idh/MocA family oxidoreductase [Chloroflexi bacterium]|nr:Gfo/Idh/MocA family oxidoreductase [Chloroflexota bacterium]
MTQSPRPIRIGMVGHGFMGKAHSHAFHDLPLFFPPDDLGAYPVLQVICGRNEPAVRAAAARYGWAHVEIDWRRLVERDDVDLVDIVASNDVHAPVAIAAAAAGKAILCEKPLARTLAEAREMLGAAQAAGVPHMVGFNSRRYPAVQLARRLIDEGAVGRVYHWRAQFFNERFLDPELPLAWRMQAETAGSGALGDLGSHAIDLARFLVGDIAEVAGATEVFVPERPLPGRPGERAPVTGDDAAIWLCRFANGALGTFEASKLAAGHKTDLSFEVNGSAGALRWHFQELNSLELYSRGDPPHARGWRRILATEPEHPFAAAYWPAGHPLGYEHSFINQAADLCRALAQGQPPSPDFVDGAACQAVMDAVLRAAKSRRWESVEAV